MESKAKELGRQSLVGNKISVFKRILMRLKDAYEFVCDLPYNIYKMLQWFPIIWKDRDWDFVFFLLLMKYKLSRIKKSMSCYSCVENEGIFESVKQCEDAIERLTDINSSYIEEELREHKRKWGEIRYDFVDLEGEDFSRLDVYSSKARAEGKEDIEREEIHAIFDLGEKRREQDLDLLFNTMRKNIQAWWS